MLDKEEAFLVNEFIRKHATRNLWEVSDKLYKLISEIKKEKELGKGGSGKVYLCNVNKAFVAVKTFENIPESMMDNERKLIER